MLQKHILVTDDHPTIHKGISLLIKEFLTDYIILSAFTFDQAKSLLEKEQIALMLLDINLPGFMGIHSFKEISSTYSNTKIVLFSQENELTNARKYLESGAYGYIEKLAPDAEIKKAISQVLRNEKYISTNLQAALFKDVYETDSYKNIKLSNKEKEIYELMLKGHRLTEIAKGLDANISTISTYKRRIYTKLNVLNDAEFFQLDHPVIKQKFF